MQSGFAAGETAAEIVRRDQPTDLKMHLPSSLIYLVLLQHVYA